jgi:lactate permease
VTWTQNYDPFGHWWLSTMIAALPVVVLLGALAILRIKAHFAALLGLATSMIVAVAVFGMPAKMSVLTAIYGAAYGFFPIGWIILNVIFMYDLNCEAGRFKVLQESLMGITQDRRLQLVLIAFAFGAFFEGAAGFGTPVAVTAAILIGIGFRPLQASGLSLIANTAPVAFGAIGTPLVALAGVTQLNLFQLSAMAGRILPFFSVLVPFWLLWAFCGFAGMIEVWPATLVAGVFFAVPQFLVSNYHGPWLVDVVSAVCSMAALTALLLVWHPKRIWGLEGHEQGRAARGLHGHSTGEVVKAWVPWVILSVIVFLWGLPSVKAALDKISIIRIPIGGLHNLIQRVPPVVVKPTAEAAIFQFNWITFSGTGILIAAILSGFLMGFGPLQLIRQYGRTL